METRNLSDLNGNPKNPRTISKHDGTALAKSMEEFGDLSGIVFNVRTSQLVGGHQRISVLKELMGGGNSQVQITQRFTAPTADGTVGIGYVIHKKKSYAYREVDWPYEREMAANIAANRIQGEFDLELLAEANYLLHENNADLLALTGQTDEEISRLLDSVGVGGQDEEEAPPLDQVNPPISKLGEIYQLGRHRLMCGDATDFGTITDLMDGKEADMIFTDPPYNVDYEGKTAEALTIQNDSMSDEQFHKFLVDVHKNLSEVTKPGASIYVCHADSEGLNFRQAFVEAGFLLKQCLIWVKQSMVMGRQDYQWQHEPILYGWKNGASHYFIDDRTQTTVWNVDRPSRSIDHPTMKPIALCARAIKNSSLRGQLVLDVFGGAGSTLLAAEGIDRTCYMMELEPRYVDVVRKRYAKHIGKENEWQDATPVIPPGTTT